MNNQNKIIEIANFKLKKSLEDAEKRIKFLENELESIKNMTFFEKIIFLMNKRK